MKVILIVCGALVILLGGIYFFDQQNNNVPLGDNNFISCLQKNEVVIYGTSTCPYCLQLVAEYDDYNDFDKIYVNCNKNMEKCSNEMLTNAVPEVQIAGELLQEWASPEVLSKKTGCAL